LLLHYAGSTFKSKFDFACQQSAIPLARNATLLSQYLSSLFAAQSNDIYPYGVDPAFLRSSTALYRPELQGKESWFYNTSDAWQVQPVTNMPYGFQHQPLQVSRQFLVACTAAQPASRRLLQACLPPYDVLEAGYLVNDGPQ
jgi:hypothetical protein